MANYILFGKGEDGKSEVDKKSIEIKTKYQSYKKKELESLDDLMSSPTFDERSLKSMGRSRYTSPKPIIDKNLSELQPLFEEIEKWEHIYKVAIGEEVDESLNPKSQT